MRVLIILVLVLMPLLSNAQNTENWIISPGVVGTFALLILVIVVGIIIMIFRASNLLSKATSNAAMKEKKEWSNHLINLEEEELDAILEERKKAFKYRLKGTELGSSMQRIDERGLITRLTHKPSYPLVDEKKRSTVNLETPEPLKKLIIFYLGAAVFWLVLGTLAGQYLGMKFVWPDLDHLSWLSFGRLRPVHTNTVFWGWTSLAMIGLGYFVITRTSNTKLFSYKLGWWGWWLINTSVILGNAFLMSGINNGGGEYREYIWPIMLLFAIALLITFWNYYKTVANRKLSEIYISNWYILAALVWTLVLVTIGYLPYYQSGLGETAIQGYYMHQGVGMWFMTFTLGLVYYYLPSSLNKPIYSYSLGVLALWTQMLFYTMIGTHHFVFSPLPWWLQTTAIVFSGGMFIPVIAGTTNFMMTIRGSWKAISSSYVLPFFLIGIIFYFVGSAQGSFQAFRFTNYVWHFTDFNVAHSHMTMYGIIAFFMWAGIYALLPKITGKEAPQWLIGAHFWLAFIGLFAYMVSLMAGGTLKGLSWMAGEPFINSVILMQPYWLWRAIGGTLMFISHLIFAYNFFYMINKRIRPLAIKKNLITEPQPELV
ncbi:cytochrome oxidase subunit I [Fulvivirga kasyanovii]|uniref:Cytochrome oxidase subunit I n=2 Tax=Fulvivirga kasyanovii TaxID=396812 RepID=A0ABW9RJC7_9BACT|nr:cytochrome oxidase subunit I [Fulvivirga kasyanovii]